MITTVGLDCQSRQFQNNLNSADISEFCREPHKVVWADVNDPTSEDFLQLAEEFGFHPLSIEDCQHPHQRPKVEEFSGYYFIVLYEAQLVGPDDELELRIEHLLGANYLVTVHSRPMRAIETARRLWPEWSDRAEHGAGLLAYLLIDAIVDDYMPLLDILSDRMDELEDRIFGEFNAEAMHEIFRIKKQLLHLRRFIALLRDVFNTMLRREQPIFAAQPTSTFRTYSTTSFGWPIRSTHCRDLLGSAMDAYLSVAGNRMNMVMKRLTSISTILMSVTLIAGIYGMNFAVMPELKWKYGYVFSLSSMVAVGVAIYAYFKRLNWRALRVSKPPLPTTLNFCKSRLSRAAP